MAKQTTSAVKKSAGSTKADASKSTTQPGAAEGTTQPGAAEGTTQPGAAEGTTQPGAAEGSTQPGAAEGTTQPGAAEGTTQPGAAEVNTQAEGKNKLVKALIKNAEKELEMMKNLNVDVLYINPDGEYFTNHNFAMLSVSNDAKKLKEINKSAIENLLKLNK